MYTSKVLISLISYQVSSQQLSSSIEIFCFGIIRICSETESKLVDLQFHSSSFGKALLLSYSQQNASNGKSMKLAKSENAWQILIHILILFYPYNILIHINTILHTTFYIF